MVLSSLPGQKASSRRGNKSFSGISDNISLNIDNPCIKILLTNTDFIRTAFNAHDVLAFEGLFHLVKVGFLRLLHRSIIKVIEPFVNIH